MSTDASIASEAAAAFGPGSGQERPYGADAPGKLYVGSDDQATRLQWMLYEGRHETGRQRQRWKASRLMFRGQHNIQVHQSSGQLRATAFDNRTGGSRVNHMNRVRTFTEARSAILTAERPKFDVLAARAESAEIDAAKQAKRLVEGMWEEWGIDDYRYDLSLNADQDGISFVSVMWDPTANSFSRRAVGPDGQEVTNPADVEALQMAGLLQYQSVAEGDFVVRVVSPIALSIDPNLVKDWKKECNWVIESRLMPTHEVEKLAGMSVGELRDHDRLRRGLEPSSGFSSSSAHSPAYMVDDDERGARVVSDNEAVLTHWAYIRPHADWPRGGCILFLDQAPAAPLIERPWEDELPYFPHVPRPDGGNILRAHGIVWDLMGLQNKINRSNWQLERWADLVGNPPLGVPIGSLRGRTIFSGGDNVFEFQPNVGPPAFMPVPAEPSHFMMNYIPWLIAQMAEIAIVADPSRGVAPGKGVESEVALQGLVQANETQLSAPERSLTKATNWMVSRILKLIGEHYEDGRLVQMPGVDDAGEYTHFKKEMVGGAHQFRIKGSTLPKSKEAMLATLMGFAPVLGEEIRPFIKELIQGDVDKFLSHEDKQSRHQRDENRRMAALAGDEKVQFVWSEFEKELATWNEAMQTAGQPLGEGHDPGDPEQALAMYGATPPNFTQMLSQAGVDVPQVSDDDGHAIHIMEVRDFVASDGYRKYPPLVRQLVTEHRTAHLEKMGGNLLGLAAQQPDPGGPGPAPPNPRGEASQPKMPGAPSGGLGPLEL